MHKAKYNQDGLYLHTVTCSCGEAPREGRDKTRVWFKTYAMAVDWFDAHLRAVEKIKHAGEKKQSLESVWAYFTEQAEREDLPEHEREQWERLAHEVGVRLGKYAPPTKQEELFTL